MKMISYWKADGKDENQLKPFYDEEGQLFLIYGYYDHMNGDGGAVPKNKRIGIYWRDDYPSSRGYLAPCVIPEQTAASLLKGLYYDLLMSGKKDKAEKVYKAIEFMNKRDK